MRRLAFIIASLVAAGLAYGQTPTRPFAAPDAVAPAAPSDVGSLGQVTFALALVLAAIFGAAWLLRRVRGFGKPAGTALDILADLPVGQKERAVLIRVGTTQILLGVAPGRVNTLHVLAEPVQLAAPISPTDATGPARPSFRDLLMKSLGK
jgi:flagellar protein FliO/FliZ